MNTSTTQIPSERKYGRDFLLNLRMHPFSLQKPKNLQCLDIVKNKLYLHQMNSCSGSQNETLSPSCPVIDGHSSSKYDADSIYRYQRALPVYFPRSCSLYGSALRCNAVSTTGSKHRSIFLPDYINPVRKLSFQCPPDYKMDLFTDEMFSSHGSSQVAPWSKHYSYEDIWNCQSRASTPNSVSKQNCGIGRNKKNPLPIINPLNGKNVLDDSTSSEGDNEPKPNDKFSSDTIEEPFTGLDIEDYLENKIKEFKIIDPNMVTDDDSSLYNSPETLSKNVDFLVLANEAPVTSSPKSEASRDKRTTVQLPEEKLNIVTEENSKGRTSNPSSPDTVEIMNTSDENSNFNVFDENILNSGNNLDIYTDIPCDHTSPNDPKGYFLPVNENAKKLEEELKENVAILEEKIYAMRQEQQKMTFVQSFLRFKKHQLEESFKSLDDKKIEIANWECNIASKEKRLLERECWMESQIQLLKNKEEKLNERERKFMNAQFRSEAISNHEKANNEVGDSFWRQEKNHYGGYRKKSAFLENVFNLEKAAGNEMIHKNDNTVTNSGSEQREKEKSAIHKSISGVKVHGKE